MTKPATITVAIPGAISRKAQTPAVPVAPSEQIESTHRAYEAGTALVHIQVRSVDETPSSDPERARGRQIMADAKKPQRTRGARPTQAGPHGRD